MTDIDSIRKTKRYERYFDGMREERKGRYVTAIALDAALLAYDAKCEELAESEAAHRRVLEQGADAMRERDDLRHHVARLGAKVSALDASLGTVIAERDAAMREREGLLAALRAIRDLRCSSFRTYEQDSKDMRRIAGAAIDAQLAALSPASGGV